MSLNVDACLEPSFPNGRIEPVVDKTYTPGDSVSVICDPDFKANSLITTCNQSRFWDPQPTCTEITCPAPTVDNGYYRMTNDTNHQGYPARPNDLKDVHAITEYRFNTTIDIECIDGFKASGPTTVICLDDGTWDKQTSTCAKILCNDTADVKHEAIIMIPDLGVNETGHVSYDSEQFDLTDGDVAVECQVNGKIKWIKKPTFGNYLENNNLIVVIKCRVSPRGYFIGKMKQYI